MSIVLLQGGGLSKEQLEQVPLHGKRSLPFLVEWVVALFTKPVGKD